MKRKQVTGILAVAAFACVLLAQATFGAKPAGNSAEAFEKLKGLVGEWESKADSAVGSKAKLEVTLTSGGNAVMEKFSMLEKDKPVEMITMYYLDGDTIRLTHYCMAGNQPTMAGTYDPATKTLTFNLSSISNLKSPDDGHMYHAVYTFLDNDTVKMVWTFRKNQKDGFVEDVTYHRTR